LLAVVGNLLHSKPAPSPPEQAKAEAVSLQALLASIVENSDDAIFSKKPDGTVLTWNKAAEAMYGYRPDEIIGQNVSILAAAERTNEARNLCSGSGVAKASSTSRPLASPKTAVP
jgi:PAS domain-containing protein